MKLTSNWIYLCIILAAAFYLLAPTKKDSTHLDKLQAVTWKAVSANNYLRVFNTHTTQYDLEQINNCAVEEKFSLEPLGGNDYTLSDLSNPLRIYSKQELQNVSKILKQPLNIKEQELPVTLDIWTKFQLLGKKLLITTLGFKYGDHLIAFKSEEAKKREVEFYAVDIDTNHFTSCQ